MSKLLQYCKSIDKKWCNISPIKFNKWAIYKTGNVDKMVQSNVLNSPTTIPNVGE